MTISQIWPILWYNTVNNSCTKKKKEIQNRYQGIEEKGRSRRGFFLKEHAQSFLPRNGKKNDESGHFPSRTTNKLTNETRVHLRTEEKEETEKKTVVTDNKMGTILANGAKKRERAQVYKLGDWGSKLAMVHRRTMLIKGELGNCKQRSSCEASKLLSRFVVVLTADRHLLSDRKETWKQSKVVGFFFFFWQTDARSRVITGNKEGDENTEVEGRRFFISRIL